jgi:hypothetical protein
MGLFIGLILGLIIGLTIGLIIGLIMGLIIGLKELTPSRGPPFTGGAAAWRLAALGALF